VTFARTPLRSAIALLFAIVHVVAAGGASVADGRVAAEAAASAAEAHIEAHGTPECPRVHLEDCTLCRVLQVHGERPSGPGVSDGGADPIASGAERVAGAIVRPEARPVSLRAPPGATAPRTRAA
jgi:hypothetical protein